MPTVNVTVESPIVLKNNGLILEVEGVGKLIAGKAKVKFVPEGKWSKNCSELSWDELRELFESYKPK